MASNSKRKRNVLNIETKLEILNCLAKGESGASLAIEWSEQQSECCPTQPLLLRRIRDLAAKKRTCTMKNWYSVRFHILHGSHSVFGYPNNRVSERCPVLIDSDKRRSTVTGA
ncbi:uncharacterized protein TNCV_1903481 [Trichonephila clavipes]|nr:uncharacterized protein TNCV_1903481 [Trichonephila clavipes]